jgi:hypothetical protein
LHARVEHSRPAEKEPVWADGSEIPGFCGL